jgi:membrane protease YdiL (CAAX protease family)
MNLNALRSPVLRISSVWVWSLAASPIIVLSLSLLLNRSSVGVFEILDKYPYFTAYFEIVSVGLMPIVFTVICRDSLSQYGIIKRGFLESLVLSLLYVISVYGFTFLLQGRVSTFESISGGKRSFPSNLWYGAVGVFAYGPLEVFFVNWLIVNTDRVFKSATHLSWGLIVTVVLFSLFHLLTTRNLYIAINVFISFFFLGVVFKYTKNSLGPMLAWTAINGQIPFYALMFLS